MSESEQIVNLIAKQTKNLLSNHWPDINEFRAEDEKIRIGFSHYITYQAQERIVETTISFGKRMKDSVVERIDTDQMNLNLAATSGNGQPAPKRRGRKPKNIIQSAIIAANAPATIAANAPATIKTDEDNE
jgi:hypothetical protein